MKKLDYATCASLLRYEPDTGKLYWRPRISGQIVPSHNRTPKEAADKWNRRYAGNEAFTARLNAGYRQGRVNREHHVAHRIAWLLSTGSWPIGQIDHINGNPEDNRIANLRDVSDQENKMNMRRPSNNSSGHIGVSWVPHLRKWHAYINKTGFRVNLGYFVALTDAVDARRRAAENLKFSSNHGRD